ncbi:MAG: hypothetical protein JWO59_693 [Chloroflexi bacterium]|nr:hypothetical protein [Chloroflexota bacterium]
MTEATPPLELNALPVTCASILRALEEMRHPRVAEWLFFRELRTGTGFGSSSNQRIDAFAIHLWPSKHYHRVAYEVKVSRSDFLVELRKPEKRRLALLYSNQFYFAAPPGIITVAELPPEAGLIEVSAGGRVEVRIAAPMRDTRPPSWNFLAAIARHIETRRKEHTTEGESTDGSD